MPAKPPSALWCPSAADADCAKHRRIRCDCPVGQLGSSHRTRPTFRTSAGGFLRDLRGGWLVSGAVVVVLWVEDLGFAEALPFGEEVFGALVVGDGALEVLGLLGCDGALHQLPITHAAPLVVGAVPPCRVVGTTAGGLAAGFGAVVEGTGGDEVERGEFLADRAGARPQACSLRRALASL